MSFEEKEYDLILDYIQGNLTDEAKENFENRMELEDDLKKEVQLHAALSLSQKDEGWVDWDHKNNQTAIAEIKAVKRSTEISELEDKITKVSDAYFNKNESRKENTHYKKYILGLVAAAVVCFFMLQNGPFNSNPSGLYDANVNWNQNLVSKIEQSTSTSDTDQQGESLFKNGEYKKAKDIFLDIVSQKESPDSHSLMYLGASYLELNQYEQALQVFNKLQKQNTLDSNRSYWYRVMVYLKKGNKEAAVNELKVLTSNSQNYNYRQALELLDQLN